MLLVPRDFDGPKASLSIVIWVPYLYSEVSITARPFFERMGFKVIKHQEVEVKGQHLTNYVMKKYLSRN